MKKICLFALLLLSIIGTADAQVGIGTTTPAQKLDIKQGRLRFTGDPSPGSVAQGIEFTNQTGVVLNGFVGTYNDSTMGFYGFAGSGWSFLHNNKNGNVGLQGNSNPRSPLSFSNATGNKISIYDNGDGTQYGMGLQSSKLQLYTPSAAQDIVLGTGSSNAFTENMRIKGNGRVGIGTDAPSEKLEVNGTVKITDGTQGDGKVLTSDANGKASWKTSAYGDKVRFCFRRDQPLQSTASWTALYNEGNTDADIDQFNHTGGSYRVSGFFIYFNTPGLYHLDVNATLSTDDGGFMLSDDNGDPLYIGIYLLENDDPSDPGFFNQKILSISYPSNFKIVTAQNGLNYKWASVDKSMDVYIKEPGGILQVSHGTKNKGAHLTVTGVKISD